MKLATASYDVDTNLKSSAFKLGDMSVILGLLSDKIYTDKPRAVIREYACNALDIHRMTGQTRPFVIALPNDVDPSITFRDYGTGLDAQQMEDLFATYGASSKRTDNGQIGGFGLGCKAGFAYGEAFTVTSYQGGVASHYACFKGSDGIFQVAPAGSQDTTEDDGLEVKIPVKRSDWYTFEQTAKDVLRWFPEGSFKILGTEVQPVTVKSRTDTWIHVENVSRHYVLMGPVAYQVDWSMVDEELPLGIIPVFDIGELELPPSREQLAYDEITKQKLKARFDEIASNYCQQVLRDVRDMQPLERVIYAATLNQGPIGKLFSAYHKSRGHRAKDKAAKKEFEDPYDFEPKWGGALLWRHENLVIPAKVRAYAKRQKRRSYTWYVDAKDYTDLKRATVNQYNARELLYGSDFKLVFHDLTDKSNPQVASRLENAPGKSFWVVQPSDDIKSLDDLHALFPDAPAHAFCNLSDFEPATRIKAKKRVLHYVSGSGNTTWFEKVEGELPDEGVYVPFEKTEYETYLGGKTTSSLLQLPMAQHRIIYGFNKGIRAKVDLDDFERLDLWVKRRAAELLKDPQFLRALTADEILRQAQEKPLGDFVWSRMLLGMDDLLTPAIEAARQLKNDLRAWSKEEIETIRVLADWGWVNLPKPKDYHGVLKQLDRAAKKNETLIFVMNAPHRFWTNNDCQDQLKRIVR